MVDDGGNGGDGGNGCIACAYGAFSAAKNRSHPSSDSPLDSLVFPSFR